MNAARLGLIALVAACGHSTSDHGSSSSDGGEPLVPPQGCDAQDTDGDGWSDAVEIAMGTDPTDPNDNPDTRHEIVFAVPLHGAPRPATQEVVTPARVARADVTVLLDTTGSMVETDTEIQPQFQELITMLAGEVDDLAFGAAGLGDFPIADSDNSQYDVPYYLVHRVMTARTPAGLASILGAMTFKNIISDGLGPWFAGMRGGDDPEQGWEALRQAATGIGITYPMVTPFTGTGAVPPFNPATAYPATLPAGEENGTIGGLGFRRDSLPIILMITDTTMHVGGSTTTTPTSATMAVALQGLSQIGARVIGIKAFDATGQTDLQTIADDTGAQVTPDAWGTGADRPANCPIGKCCLVADDPSVGGTAVQPAPVGGECSLVFQADRYDTNLAQMLAQAVIAVAHGVRFDASASVVDDPSDTVDTVAAFVDHVEAVTDGACASNTVQDTNGDGIPDTFEAVVPGTDVCFQITARINTTVQTTGKFHAVLQPTGDGLADLAPVDVWFVVPPADCGMIQ